ncbi:shikimate kinase [Pedobacter heparinus]|uniref:Shikimate kinase n=1 Tax=Pedobacter heparinus (strain ATCC 13125 / DSM 2366 / CIP 104194 / JCM 7457 / NBRC 12017 / NCIMB 9290 / NRRL B-14731 / HIM 762-3) TaxID=485917 RepID=C6XU57_PEDHD|nr:Shikimate kinase [Pedobacter heparinus DSM 2366]
MMKIFLIGFMGCGKSTMGKKLAVKLGYDFVDLDQQIEKNIGKTIGAYFSEHGEAAFRKLESDTLKHFDYPANVVIATGGGAPCFFDNMDWMNANGLTMYIEMPPAALAKRLESGKEKRPLLRDLNEAQMIEFIENRLAERDVFYKRAALVIDGINLNADAMRALILSQE